MDSSVVLQPELASDPSPKDKTDYKPKDNGDGDTSAVMDTSPLALKGAPDNAIQGTSASANDNQLASGDIAERIAKIETRFERFAELLDPKSMGEPLEIELVEGFEELEYGEIFDLHTRSARRNITTVMWFLGRARAEAERATIARREQEAKRREAKTSGAAVENAQLKSLEELSLAACVRNETAEVRWLGWTQFVASRGSFDHSVTCPIQAVIGEPEPQVVSQLKDLAKVSGVPNEVFLGVRKTEHFKLGNDGEKQTALPERIKLHSEPLYQILKDTMQARDSWVTRSDDGTLVFLRPFKELIYYERQLKDRLEILEKSWNERRQPDDHLKDFDKAAGADTDHGDSSTAAKDRKDEKDSIVTGATMTRKDNACEVDESVPLSSSAKEGEGLATPATNLLHLRCLVGFMDDEIKPKLDYIEGPGCVKILFHDLWHLFKPGHMVIDQKEKQAYRVVRIEVPRHKAVEPWLRWSHRRLGPEEDSDDEPDEDTPVKVHCAYIDFDGKQFGPVSGTFTIQPYGSEKDVKSLPVYPLRFAKDVAIQKKLIDRGKMLLDVATFRPMYYSGITLDSRDEIDSQVVVDFSEALANEERREWTPKIDGLRTAPERSNSEMCTAACCSGQAVYDDEYIDSRLTEDFVKSLIPDRALRAPSLLLSPRPLEEIQAGQEDQPTDDEFLIMTYRVFAFVLRSRKWAQLDLTFLRYQNEDARDFALSAFDQLALPDGHRDMVESLVTQHFRDRQSSSNEQTDLVKGKGKGLILLLHGAPGVGKTTTAEGVAEKFQKPLFQITCGDLGNTARDVEGELEKNFSLASRWGCILLLDEADVFLSARERKDFERNGLVAVFLRVLEYYAGILFLTTNRVGDFDEAFASRIHMSLYYPELDETKTRRVFELNLDLIRRRFDRQARKLEFDASSIDSFAAQHFQNYQKSRWNGRQIRNLCQTALALAEFDAHERTIDTKVQKDVTVKLQLKYFETVQKAYVDFGWYLGNIRGTEGDQRAFDYNYRARQGTAFETTPNRFSGKGDDARHGGRVGPLSESQSSAQGDPFTSFGGQSYPTGGSSNMRPSYSQQYSPGHGYANNPGMARYDGPQGYPQANSQHGQQNPNYYPVQQIPQMGFNPQVQQNMGAQNMRAQNMGAQNMGVQNMGMSHAQPGQPHQMQQPQGQNLQVPQYSYPAMPTGPQSDTMGGANSPGQVAQGGPVGDPRFGGGPGGNDR